MVSAVAGDVTVMRIDSARAAGMLRATGDGGRGFLGLDPVTHNDELLAAELDRLGTQVFARGDDLLAFGPNPHQARQAVLATTSADPDVLRDFIGFLTTFQRCTSFVSTVTVGSEQETVLIASGFTLVGTLSGHRYEAGRFRDAAVYWTG